MSFRIDVSTGANSGLSVFLCIQMLLLFFIVIVLLHVHLHLEQLVVIEAVSMLAFLDFIKVFLDRASDLPSCPYFI